MEITIFYGRPGSYTSDGKVVYTCHYMNTSGTAHRDTISQSLYNKLKSSNIEPGSMVIGIFEIDDFNKITLVDINL